MWKMAIERKVPAWQKEISEKEAAAVLNPREPIKTTEPVLHGSVLGHSLQLQSGPLPIGEIKQHHQGDIERHQDGTQLDQAAGIV